MLQQLKKNNQNYRYLSLVLIKHTLSIIMRTTHLLFVLLVALNANAQTNFYLSHPAAVNILKGNYNPADYAASQAITDPLLVASEIQARISPDSLKAYITRLSQFGTRNSGADTVSTATGIGASRRWIESKFQQFGMDNEDRLLVGMFRFDQAICNMGRHSNVMAILPGTNPAANGIVLIEGHFDSRCDALCDVNCPAEGVEDNATGTALVMELARVMSKYSFPNTLVFMATTAEEQGLYGAAAFAQYAKTNNLPIRAVLNNDVIGGVICGLTSSPPSCPGVNDVDSTSVRLFSSGGFNSAHKQLSRYIKLQYKEHLLATAPVPMLIRIMSPEDRTGRGGDHIPFRERGYPAMRFTAANEHGDASNGPNYSDRQHTSEDILGIDTDGDQVIDSFFVQFNYLARNAVINGNAAASIARGVPAAPSSFNAIRSGSMVTVDIANPIDTLTYRIALRSTTNDWDTVYTLTNSNLGSFPCNATGALYVSIATVDNSGVESLFSIEKIAITSGSAELGVGDEQPNFKLLPNRPNPFDEATWISFWVEEKRQHKTAIVRVSDREGRILMDTPIDFQQGMNEVLYTHGYGATGLLTCTLLIDGKVADAITMVFAM